MSNAGVLQLRANKSPFLPNVPFLYHALAHAPIPVERKIVGTAKNTITGVCEGSANYIFVMIFENLGMALLQIVKEAPRRTLRFPFATHAEIVREESGEALPAQVNELMMNGCYLDFVAELPNGAHVRVKICAESEFFEASANVISVQQNLGVGLAFRDVKQHFVPIFQKWLLAVMRDKPAEMSNPADPG
jgi:hypothetical protein